jgi:hypothetical protein
MRNSANGMVHYHDYVAGWLDGSIHDLLPRLPGTARSTRFALITCLDSDLAPGSLLRKSPALRPIADAARVVKKGILVPTARLLEADIENQVFFGFDEVWFFPDDDIKPRPDSAWLVGPNRIDRGKLDKLGSWMTDNGCSLALGDGDGLNFVVKAHGLVKHVIAYSMSQPQPTAGGEEEMLSRKHG